MVWHGILHNEPNPRSRPSDLIGLCKPCSQDSGGEVDQGMGSVSLVVKTAVGTWTKGWGGGGQRGDFWHHFAHLERNWRELMSAALPTDLKSPLAPEGRE